MFEPIPTSVIAPFIKNDQRSRSDGGNYRTALRVALFDHDPATHSAVGHLFTQMGSQLTLRSYDYPKDVIDAFGENPPHVILLEPCVSGRMDLQSIRQLKGQFTALPLIIFSARANLFDILLSLAAGADGYLIKPIACQEFIDAVGRAECGQTILCERCRSLAYSFQLTPHPSPPRIPLTWREEEIMGLLIKRSRNKEIADQLGIRTETVQVHLANIYKKLGVHHRADACRKYLGIS